MAIIILNYRKGTKEDGWRHLSIVSCDNPTHKGDRVRVIATKIPTLKRTAKKCNI